VLPEAAPLEEPPDRPGPVEERANNLQATATAQFGEFVAERLSLLANELNERYASDIAKARRSCADDRKPGDVGQGWAGEVSRSPRSLRLTSKGAPPRTFVATVGEPLAQDVLCRATVSDCRPTVSTGQKSLPPPVELCAAPPSGGRSAPPQQQGVPPAEQSAQPVKQGDFLQSTTHAEPTTQGSVSSMARLRKSQLNFQMHPSWKLHAPESPATSECKPLGMGRSKAGALSSLSLFTIQSFGGSRRKDEIQCKHFVIHPEARRKVLWVFLGACLLAHDIIVLPLQLASVLPDDDSSNYFSRMQWVSIVFWTLDLILNFFTGFYREGLVELTPKVVAKHYLVTWFAIDVFILFVDFVSCVVGVLSDSNVVARLVRATRMVRAMRLLRLMRFRRLLEVASRVLDSCDSEAGAVVLRLVGVLCTMLTIVHFVACIWYAVGRMGYEASEPSWLASVHDGGHPGYGYTCAFHWALTQFTPATQNISPISFRERLLANFVVMVALVSFSSFLAKVTSAMTQLLSMNARTYGDEVTLRRFLGESNISRPVAQSVWQIFRQQQRNSARQRKLTLPDILSIVPMPHKVERDVKHELYRKPLLAHPLFDRALRGNTEDLRNICMVLIERSAPRVEVIFSVDTLAEGAICAASGTMVYECRMLTEAIEVSKNEWISEAALWGSWHHVGTLSTVSTSRWLELTGESLRHCVQERSRDTRFRLLASKYAELFDEESEFSLHFDINVGEDDVAARMRMVDAAAEWLQENGGRFGAQKKAVSLKSTLVHISSDRF